jgi:hypothetical protein
LIVPWSRCGPARIIGQRAVALARPAAYRSAKLASFPAPYDARPTVVVFVQRSGKQLRAVREHAEDIVEHGALPAR